MSRGRLSVESRCGAVALGLEVDEGTEHAALQAAGEFAEEAGEGSAYEPEVPLLTAAGGSD